jgi:hypothetical protein
VDLGRLSSEGDDWLSAEERYALKMHGVCAGTTAPVHDPLPYRWGEDLERHSARARGHRRALQRGMDPFDDPAAGRGPPCPRPRRHRGSGRDRRDRPQHELDLRAHDARRDVLPTAGIGLDEPFDCYPDASMVSESILTRVPELNTRMPRRLNILFGGCVECRDHAKINDVGFVSKIRDNGELGYELLVGGSLGKSSPRLAIKAIDLLGRRSESSKGPDSHTA